MAEVLVTGGSSMVGDFLLPALAEAGHRATVFSRQPHVSGGSDWVQVDVVHTPLRELAARADALIHLAPLPLLTRVLPGLPVGVTRIVAVGTTSVFTKVQARSMQDRKLVEEQQQAERALADYCTGRGIHWALLRPTLVYDGRRDRNVTRIAHFIRRAGFFAVAAPGIGLRQPLHAADLAAACQAALDSGGGSRDYNLGGGETLSYRAMLERIFRALGRRPRILPVPLALYRGALAAARLHPRFRGLSLDVADRMNQDLVFDYGDAARDLGFHPRAFAPEFAP
jgi:nucleoside-diphosphate-sugar epimerase